MIVINEAAGMTAAVVIACVQNQMLFLVDLLATCLTLTIQSTDLGHQILELAYPGKNTQVIV